MKKMTALVLALGLTVPAQAWTLFPVRKEIVTVKETNWAVTFGTAFIILGACSLIGYNWHTKIQETAIAAAIEDEAVKKWRPMVVNKDNSISQQSDQITALRQHQEQRDREADAILDRTRQDLGNQIHVLERDKATLEADVASKTEELAHLTVRFNSSSSENKGLHTDLDKARAGIEAQKNIDAQLRDDLRQKTLQLKDLRATLEARDQKIAELEADVEELNGTLEERDQRIANLEKNEQEQMAKISKLATPARKYKEAETDLSNKILEINHYKSEIASMSKQIEMLSSEIASLQSK
jgi:chromosome segregation ATPase